VVISVHESSSMSYLGLHKFQLKSASLQTRLTESRQWEMEVAVRLDRHLGRSLFEWVLYRWEKHSTFTKNTCVSIPGEVPGGTRAAAKESFAFAYDPFPDVGVQGKETPTLRQAFMPLNPISKRSETLGTGIS
jgi:hypothetical protein